MELANFLQLPEEVWIEILSKFAPQELINISLTNKFFYRLSNEPLLWHAIFVNRFGEKSKVRKLYSSFDEIQWKVEYQWRNTLNNRVDFFNKMPKECVKSLIDDGFIKNDQDAAHLFSNLQGLKKTNIYNILLQPQEYGFSDQLFQIYLHEAVKITGLDLLEALRLFISLFGLPSDHGSMRTCLHSFADYYFEVNSDLYECCTNSEQIYLLFYSMIMLNTDAHHPSVKYKMKPTSFVTGLKSVDGLNFPDEILENFYYSIKENEIMKKDFKLFNHPGTAKPKKKNFLKLAEEEEIFSSGWLKVKTRFRIKKRWFILTSKHFIYYNKKPSPGELSYPIGYIALNNSCSCKLSDNNQLQFTFSSSTKNFTLSSSSKDETSKWVNQISQRIAYADQSSTKLCYEVFVNEPVAVEEITEVPLEQPQNL